MRHNGSVVLALEEWQAGSSISGRGGARPPTMPRAAHGTAAAAARCGSRARLGTRHGRRHDTHGSSEKKQSSLARARRRISPGLTPAARQRALPFAQYTQARRAAHTGIARSSTPLPLACSRQSKPRQLQRRNANENSPRRRRRRREGRRRLQGDRGPGAPDLPVHRHRRPGGDEAGAGASAVAVVALLARCCRAILLR